MARERKIAETVVATRADVEAGRTIADGLRANLMMAVRYFNMEKEENLDKLIESAAALHAVERTIEEMKPTVTVAADTEPEEKWVRERREAMARGCIDSGWGGGDIVPHDFTDAHPTEFGSAIYCRRCGEVRPFKPAAEAL